MARPSNNTALGIALQPVRDVYTAPNSTTDLLAGVSNLRFTQDPITITDDSYTGSIFQNADAVAGKRVGLTFNTKLKGPSALPAANAFVLGRLLQSAKFTEVRNAVAIGPETLGVGVDSKTATLGASAVGTLDLYKGFPIKIGAAAYKSAMTAIRSYDASKHAVLMEDWLSTPTGNYTIPTFLGYFRDVTSAAAAILSLKLWLSGVRYDLINCAVTGLRIVRPTSTIDQAAYPELEWTLGVTINAIAEDATPTIPAVGAIPLAKDGKEWLAYEKIGTASSSIDLGLEADYPPNMNQVDGVDAPELAGGRANGDIQMQSYLPSYLDTQSLADAQSYNPYFAQWGNSAWNMVQLLVPDARLGFPNPDTSGRTVVESAGLFIDVIDRNLGIVFPG